MGFRYWKRRRRKWPKKPTAPKAKTGSASPSSFRTGIEDDVRAAFFALDKTRLGLLFDSYESHYGAGPRRYAQKVFEQWKSGQVVMSGRVSERLVLLLPRCLDFDQKYKLVEKLWLRYQRKTRLRVEIDPTGDVDGTVAAVAEAAVTANQNDIPAVILQRLEWLTNSEGQSARVLLAQIARRKGQVIAEALKQEVGFVVQVIRESPARASATHVAELPFASVEIIIRQKYTTPAGQHRMSDAANKPAPASQPTGLVPTVDTTPRAVVSVQNPKDILTEAVKHLSPAQAERVVGAAAEELVRIGAMEKEGQIETNLLRDKLDTVSAVVQEHAANPQVRTTAQVAHRGASGAVTVTFETGKPPPPPQAKGACFVATACFGDYDHPTVLALRRFRDERLLPSAAGRRFVDVYYRYGPLLASALERLALLKPLARGLLGLLAKACSRSTRE